MRRISSSMQFALGVSAVFALAALVAGGISYDLQSRDLTQRLEADVQRVAESLARTQDPQDLAEQIAALIATAPDGALLVDWRAPDGAESGNTRVTTRFEGARHLTSGRDVQPLASNPPDGYFAYAMPVAGGWLMAARDDAWITENREILAQTTAWGLGAALILSVALAIAVGARNEARIARMQEVLEAVGTGDHARRIAAEGQDDLARVGQQVDATLDRLQAGIAAIRQVSTDVAHDLRAPLSRLRLRLEPLAGQPEVAGALGEIDGISATFDAILRLARLQSGSVNLQTQPLEAGALLREVAELFDAPLRLDLPRQPAPFAGDRELLVQALVNLVDNALRHGGGDVDLTATVQPSRVQFTVADHGPGIAQENHALVLQRFARLDESRSTSGTGLGLALAAAIARHHHGNLRLDDNAPGLRVMIDVPAA